MRVLSITPQLPWPPDSGGRAAVHQWLRWIGRRHEVTLLSFALEPPAAEARVALEGICARVEVVARRLRSPLSAALGSLRSGEPHTLVPFVSAEMGRRVAELADPGRIDLVQVEMVHMARYEAALPVGLPRILRTHNVESAILERYAAHRRNPLVAAYAALQSRRLRRYEADACARFDRCLAVTEVDTARLRSLSPAARIDCIPVGVDDDAFRPDAFPVVAEPTRVVTTGDYSWAPTADGLRFLVHEVWPRVRAALPQARLSVVGRDAPDLGADPRGRGIDVLGRVPDVRPEILRANVFVVPTRIGSGIRVKAIEALALGRAVVSTRIGCEGIEVEPGEHLLVADAPAEIAAQVVALLRDPAHAAALGAAGAARVVERYAWSRLADRFDAVYAEVVASRRARGGSRDRPASDAPPSAVARA